MAMSVMEAMTLGLVPVVTPVGEIAHYAQAAKNAVVVHDDAAAAAEVLALLDDPDRFGRLSGAARATWSEQRLYHEDFTAACTRLLEGDPACAG